MIYKSCFNIDLALALVWCGLSTNEQVNVGYFIVFKIPRACLVSNEIALKTIDNVSLILIHSSLLELNGIIPDKNFAASSMESNNKHWRASEGRLNNTRKGAGGVWCAHKDDKNPWLRVKLVETAQVTRIAIQGSPKIPSRLVKKYKISYSINGKSWTVYQENGMDHVSIYCTFSFNSLFDHVFVIFITYQVTNLLSLWKFHLDFQWKYFCQYNSI